MSIVSCELQKTGQGGSVNLEEGYCTPKLRYLIRTDDTANGMYEVLHTCINAGLLPAPYSYYRTATEHDYNATLRSYDPQQQAEDPRLWDVTLNYSSQYRPQRDAENAAQQASNFAPTDGSQPQAGGGQGQGNQDQNNPIGREPDISWSFAAYQRPTMEIFDPDYFDDHGLYIPVVTSAGEPFDPPVEVDDCRPVYRVSRNERFFNPAVAFDYMNAVNLDVFKGAKPGQAKIQSITGEQQRERNIVYARVTYEIHFRTDTEFGWQLRVLDMGTQKKVGGEFRPIIRKSIPVANPVLLDGAGGVLEDADIAAGNVHYRTFNVYKKRKFSKLRLP